MPRRSILSSIERHALLCIPETQDELIKHYSFSETDLSMIQQHRGAANQLGFAIQLCYMRYPSIILGVDEVPSAMLLRLVSQQLGVDAANWAQYGQREQTRREHLIELQTALAFQTFTTTHHYQPTIHGLSDLAQQTDKGIVLATALVEKLRQQRILLPSINVIERICAEAITRANRLIYAALTNPTSISTTCSTSKKVAR